VKAIKIAKWTITILLTPFGFIIFFLLNLFGPTISDILEWYRRRRVDKRIDKEAEK
jgi:hypothetical protein